jgi:3-hydroxyisobutyrate dehydrogenase-like beta-hydroxyacid dehydrogenase
MSFIWREILSIQTKMDVGFIGLGKMGSPMTKNLLRAGYNVNIYDKNPSTFNPLVRLGANKQSSIKDIGKASDCIFIMVYPPDSISEVIFNETEGLLAGIKCKERKKESYRYPIIIDGGNADYIKSIDIGQRLSKLGVDYMDVGFSGGPGEAEGANLAAFVGGNHEVFDQIHPLLSALCNRDKINYLGQIGSGHFAKVMAHNTTEYVIMGIIGEIASLSSEIGDHKKIMMAVNGGLAETRLGELYLELSDKDIENTGCKIGSTQNAAELALREGKRYNIGMLLVTAIYYLRKISEELFEFNSICDATKNNMIQDMLSQLDMLEQEQKQKGTVRSMAIQAQLRRQFGGHPVYKRKEPDGNNVKDD